MKFIISLLLGMMPEVLFLTLFIVFFRNIEKKRVRLFLLLLLGYLALIIVVKFQLLFYIAYIVYSYLIVKWLYKAHIIDFFVISLSYAYMTLISFGCFKLINDYWVAFAINRLLLFAPLLFRSKIRLFYEKYRSLWNINKNAQIVAQQNEINALRLKASQEAQNNYLISQLGEKCPVPAFVVNGPTPVNFPTNCCNTFSGFNSCGNY